jgi:hypothetical protein
LSLIGSFAPRFLLTGTLIRQLLEPFASEPFAVCRLRVMRGHLGSGPTEHGIELPDIGSRFRSFGCCILPKSMRRFFYSRSPTGKVECVAE